MAAVIFLHFETTAGDDSDSPSIKVSTEASKSRFDFMMKYSTSMKWFYSNADDFYNTFLQCIGMKVRMIVSNLFFTMLLVCG